MRRLTTTVVVVLAGFACAAPALKDRPTPSALVGEWEVELMEGQGMTVHVRPGECRYTFTPDGRWVVTHGGTETVGGRYKVDASASPAAIDMTLPQAGQLNRKAPILGIFEVDGDTLRLCCHATGDRPTGFAAGKASGAGLQTFKRVRP
jgi:uncharacterized protein (TIGR03067 family)